MLDPDLFGKDFFVQEMLRFTPRTYYHGLIYLLAKTGLGVAPAHALLFGGALASLLAGLQAIAALFYRSRITTAIFIFWALSATAGTIGGSILWPSTPIAQAYALGLAVWGGYYSLRCKWPLAYAFFGAACLLQFLVGFLPALLVSPMLVRETWRTRRWGRAALAVTFLAVGAGLVYLPMLAQGTTSTSLLTHREFVEIYGYIRHPHHTIPSAWPAGEWLQMILFYGGGILCLLKARSLQPVYRIGLLVVVGVMGLGLLVNFLFVEVWPLAFVAKMQGSRMTPFAQLAVLIGLSVLLYEYLERRNGLICILLIVAPVSRSPGLFLLLVALSLRGLENLGPRLPSKQRWSLAALIVAGLYPFPLSLDLVLWAQTLVEGPALLVILLTPALLARWVPEDRSRTTVAAALAAVACIVLFVGLGGMLPDRLNRLVAQKVTVQGVWQDEVTDLALRFRRKSPKDALVLIPPSLQQFRLMARRSVVVDEKAFPFTDRGMLTWRTRMEAVASYADRTPSYLVEVARRYRASYILSRQDWHPILPGEAVDREGAWIIWKIAAAPQE